MKIHFFGAAETVTGSKTLIETEGLNILVDCGMFQGLKELRVLNRAPLPFNVESIDCVILTHGHLDHCGWLPLLIKNGFQGKIYCSAPTKEIVKLILSDSAKIQDEEAEKANKENYSKHHPAEPLYNLLDAEKVFPRLKVVHLEEQIKLTENVSFSLFYASHILGACSLSLNVNDERLVFSGDIGQDDDVLLFPPTKPTHADYIFLESTYGDRLHSNNDVSFDLELFINNTIQKNGNVIIPSFAVERVQTMMYYLWQLRKENRIPKVQYIIDTPMGINVLQLFLENSKWHKLTPIECEEMCKMFTLISDYRDTIETIYNKQPKVIIAASGMITGGRVLSYLERYIDKPENTILLVGYQAEGTRGRKLLEGAKVIKMYGKFYEVKASIFLVEGLSAHGDQKDLIYWLKDLKTPPKKIFLVHGEESALKGLKEKIENDLGYEVIQPKLNQVFEL